jgi:hypothetical protein
MKHIDPQTFVQAVPVEVVPRLTTRQEKLLYVAKLIRNSTKPMNLYHNLEHKTQQWFDEMNVSQDGYSSFFTLALSDPHLKAAGVGDTFGKQMQFFELSKDDLHEFSCDCGGDISNIDMAKRIERLANGSGFLATVRAFFSR